MKRLSNLLGGAHGGHLLPTVILVPCRGCGHRITRQLPPALGKCPACGTAITERMIRQVLLRRVK
jgi:rubrerythrin